MAVRFNDLERCSVCASPITFEIFKYKWEVIHCRDIHLWLDIAKLDLWKCQRK
mgnify:CR=1 FL=1